VLAFSVASLIVTPVAAHAASITQTQAMIEALTNRLSRLEKTSEITSNQYDADRVKLATITANIKNLQGKEKGKRAAIKVTQKALVADIVRAYVLGASDAQIIALFNQNATQFGSRTVYENEVIGNLNQLKHEYQKEKISLDSTIRLVGIQRVDAGRQTYAMSRLLSLNIYNTDTTQRTLHKMTLALKGEIITYEIQQGVVAAKSHDLAAEETAITAASAVGGQNAANEVTKAIEQASQTITSSTSAAPPRVWRRSRPPNLRSACPTSGAARRPTGLRLFGLVQWAWAKAGIQIPRTTESQWPDLVHVPLNDLQPGDLLFYFNLDGDNAVDHVVMYVGSGPYGSSTVIAAAYTGTNIGYEPVFTNGLEGAARP